MKIFIFNRNYLMNCCERLIKGLRIHLLWVLFALCFAKDLMKLKSIKFETETVLTELRDSHTMYRAFV